MSARMLSQRATPVKDGARAQTKRPGRQVRLHVTRQEAARQARREREINAALRRAGEQVTLAQDALAEAAHLLSSLAGETHLAPLVRLALGAEGATRHCWSVAEGIHYQRLLISLGARRWLEPLADQTDGETDETEGEAS